MNFSTINIKGAIAVKFILTDMTQILIFDMYHTETYSSIQISKNLN